MARRPHIPLPIGWPLLPRPDANGEIDWPTLDQSVAQSIRVILSTRPGEQLMRPDFAAGLDRFVHAQNTLTTRRRIRDLVNESLERWEPRIILDRVEVAEVTDAPTHVRVEIAYRVRRTGEARMQGLTLETGG